MAEQPEAASEHQALGVEVMYQMIDTTDACGPASVASATDPIQE